MEGIIPVYLHHLNLSRIKRRGLHQMTEKGVSSNNNQPTSTSWNQWCGQTNTDKSAGPSSLKWGNSIFRCQVSDRNKKSRLFLIKGSLRTNALFEIERQFNRVILISEAETSVVRSWEAWRRFALHDPRDFLPFIVSRGTVRRSLWNSCGEAVHSAGSPF